MRVLNLGFLRRELLAARKAADENRPGGVFDAVDAILCRIAGHADRMDLRGECEPPVATASGRDKSIEDVRWAMGFLSYVGAGARDDSWDEIRSRARQHARELAEAVADLDGDPSPAPPGRDDAHAVYADVRTYLGAKAPALAERFEAAILHDDAGMREVGPRECDARIEAPAPGIDLAELAANLQPGGYLSLTIYGTPIR